MAREPRPERARVRRERHGQLRTRRVRRPRALWGAWDLPHVWGMRRRLLAEGNRAETRTGSGRGRWPPVRGWRHPLAHAAHAGALDLGVVFGTRAERPLVR